MLNALCLKTVVKNTSPNTVKKEISTTRRSVAAREAVGCPPQSHPGTRPCAGLKDGPREARSLEDGSSESLQR